MFKRGLDSMPVSAPRANSDGMIFDFYLKYEQKAQIIFLDEIDSVPSEMVHPLFFDRQQHLIACQQSSGHDCFLCDFVDSLPRGETNRPYARPMAFFSIIDLTPYEKKDGTVIPATKKLLKANKGTVEMIRREMDDEGSESLFGSLWAVSRGKEKSPKPAAVGDKYSYKKKVDMDALLEQLGGDANLIQPFTVEELNELVIYDMDKAAEVFAAYKESAGFEAKPTGFKGAKLSL